MTDPTFNHAIHSPLQRQPGFALVTISSTDWSSDLLYCENDADIVSNGLTFVAGHVGISLPNEGEGVARGVMAIDNYAGNITPLLRAAEEIIVKAQIVLLNSPDTIRREWNELLWKNVSCTTIARGTLEQRSYAQELWPPKVHNDKDVPGSRW